MTFILDLFCGAGGAAVGYQRAFRYQTIIGVDRDPQPRYPFAFIQADALGPIGWTLARQAMFVHASPPCQRYSDLAHRNNNADDHPDLIEPSRQMLEASGRPWVIENVEGAPLRDPVTLCGVSFPGLRVIRHRLFESNLELEAPAHKAHPLCYTRDKRKAHYGLLDEATAFVSVNGGGNCSVAAARSAMGIGWMTKAELNEAVPPAYTEFIGLQLISQL